MVLLVVCLVLMTIAWPVAMWRMALLWQHKTTFFDVRDGPNFRYRQARVRAMPALVGVGGPFLVAGWILLLNPPSHGVPPTAAQLIAVVCFLLTLVVVFGVAPAIMLINRPKFCVPAHLRSQPGLRTPRPSSAG